MFFPSHEHVIRPIQLLVVKCVRVEGLGILVECKKLALKIYHQSEITHLTKMSGDDEKDLPNVFCQRLHQRPTCA